MAIMNKMREHMAVILFIVLLLFLASMTIGGLVGGANIVDIIFGRNPNAVAEVNGKNIPFESFYKAYQQEIINYREQTGREPEGLQLESIEDRVFEGIVQNTLLSEVLRKKGLKAYDEEVVFEIFNNPPDILRQNPVFQDSTGAFDINRYHQILRNPEADWRPVEDYVRSTLPLRKLQREILSAVRVSEEELRQEFARRNVKVRARYAIFDAQAYLNQVGPISDEEVAKYYEQHKKDFEEPEKRKIRYVLIENKPSPNDSAETRRFAQELLERIRQGEDFAELAKAHSEDEATAEAGGDLGFFPRGAMVKPFEEAAFGAQPGQVIGPVQSPYGLHLIKVEAKRREGDKEEVQARHILLKFRPSVQTTEGARSRAEYIATRAKEVGLRQVAQAESVQVHDSGFFIEGSYIPGIGMNRRISNFVFHNPEGAVSEVYELERGFYVVEVAEIQKTRIRPLSEVKPQIQSILRQQKSVELAGNACREAYAKIQRGASLYEVVDEPSRVREPEPFTARGPVPGLGTDNSFLGAVFALAPGEISPPVKGNRGWFLIELISRDEFDEQAYRQARPQLYNELLQQKRMRAYSEWLASLKESAEIKDYRYYFFR
ncbi:MAG: peptidylprolyl isomerase [candidate division KSB1 bacterium]|nr:peptidylprolyl isomerase [candidate division KSB1 bacterium]